MGLLIWGLVGADGGGKEDVILIGVGGFGLLCSLAFIVVGRIRSRRIRG